MGECVARTSGMKKKLKMFELLASWTEITGTKKKERGREIDKQLEVEEQKEKRGMATEMQTVRKILVNRGYWYKRRGKSPMTFVIVIFKPVTSPNKRQRTRKKRNAGNVLHENQPIYPDHEKTINQAKY